MRAKRAQKAFVVRFKRTEPVQHYSAKEILNKPMLSARDSLNLSEAGLSTINRTTSDAAYVDIIYIQLQLDLIQNVGDSTIQYLVSRIVLCQQ